MCAERVNAQPRPALTRRGCKLPGMVQDSKATLVTCPADRSALHGILLRISSASTQEKPSSSLVAWVSPRGCHTPHPSVVGRLLHSLIAEV